MPRLQHSRDIRPDTAKRNRKKDNKPGMDPGLHPCANISTHWHRIPDAGTDSGGSRSMPEMLSLPAPFFMQESANQNVPAGK